MIDIHLLPAFIATATILTITPGVDTAMVLRAAMAEGRRSALFSAAGIASGCLIWGAAVSLGLGALLRASEIAYTVVKFAGAAYLAWLGLKLLLKPRTSLGATGEGDPSGSRHAAFRRGFLTNLLNPKVGVFYMTFLPQFVPLDVSVASYSFILACIHVLLTLAWFAVLISATMPLNRFLRCPKAIGVFDRLTGGVFLAFAGKLAAASAR